MSADWFRPPEPDEMPGQPWAPAEGSFRDLVIKQYLAVEAAKAQLARTWQGRMLLRYLRLRAWLRR